jgi:starvation-inducible DNA-binding protein
LEEVPAHSYKQYLKLSKVEPAEFVSEGNICVELTLNSLTEIIRKQREIMNEAAAADDEGTASIMSDYIREQEKLTWMYSAYIN